MQNDNSWKCAIAVIILLPLHQTYLGFSGKFPGCEPALDIRGSCSWVWWMIKGNLHAPAGWPSTAWIMNVTIKQLILTSRTEQLISDVSMADSRLCVCESLLCKQLMGSTIGLRALCTVIVVTHLVLNVIPKANASVVSFVDCFCSWPSWGSLFDSWPGQVSKKCVNTSS